MAGIGFELRRMIDLRQGFVAKVRAYSCAALIASGPWLMTILTLTLLNVAGPYLGGTEGYSLFRGLVTYAFAFSLILQGIVQMAVTRWVADALYGKRYEDVLPAFAACITVTGAVHALIGIAFSIWAGFGVRLALLAVTLFTIIGMTWIALIWLSLVRQYDDVLRAYVYGTLVAMVGVLLVFLSDGTEPILAAYTAGQAFTLVLLLRTILRGMETGGKRDYRVFRSLISFPVLAGVGFAYNAAIWVDKMVFWFADGQGPHRLVRYHSLYDTCSFLAYLTVVPALALNLVQLETSFYEKYRAYYGAILAGSPLGVIERNRTRMFESLQEGVVRLLRIQGAITAAVVIFAPLIMQALDLPEIAVRLFRLTCLGAGFHVLLLICILMQMYFDLRRQALATSVTFLLLNGSLAWWSVNRGIETYGVGYAVASFLTLLLGFVLLQRAIERLDYHTFTSQPIGSKEERREAEKLLEEEQEREAKALEAPAAQPAATPVAAREPVPFAAGEMGTIDAGEPAETAPAEAPDPGVEVTEGVTPDPDTRPAPVPDTTAPSDSSVFPDAPAPADAPAAPDSPVTAEPRDSDITATDAFRTEAAAAALEDAAGQVEEMAALEVREISSELEAARGDLERAATVSGAITDTTATSEGALGDGERTATDVGSRKRELPGVRPRPRMPEAEDPAPGTARVPGSPATDVEATATEAPDAPPPAVASEETATDVAARRVPPKIAPDDTLAE